MFGGTDSETCLTQKEIESETPGNYAPHKRERKPVLEVARVRKNGSKKNRLGFLLSRKKV